MVALYSRRGVAPGCFHYTLIWMGTCSGKIVCTDWPIPGDGLDMDAIDHLFDYFGAVTQGSTFGRRNGLPKGGDYALPPNYMR